MNPLDADITNHDNYIMGIPYGHRNKNKFRYMKDVSLTIVVFFLISTFASSQYVSTVTVPDKTVPKITSQNDSSFRYASGISERTLRDHLKIIASDSFEGRETGQKGIALASAYLQKIIGNLGLLPVPETKKFYQDVNFTFSKWKESNLYVNKERFRLLWDYIMITSNNQSMPEIKASEVIFAGYGIDESKYSDYKKINVKDQIIMINKGEPIDHKGNSIVTGKAEPSVWAMDMNKKLQVAKSKGAKLVLIIEDDIKKLLEDNRRELLSGSMELGNHLNKTFNTANHIYISSTIAKAIIGKNENKVLNAREKYSKGKPESVTLKTEVVINMTKDISLLEGQNVFGFIKGKTKPEEYVIASAHYDHLGKRGDEIFNGANDNGSGTVTLLELAQSCQQAVMEGNPPQRSIVFLWFCGEEKGLLGSKYYSENPVFPLAKTVADINIDMVGRVDEKYKDNPDYIYVIGSDRLSTDLHKINESVNQKYTQLTLDYTYNDDADPNRYYFRSDHYNFAAKGVPAIFYFNGTHEDYHRTTDDIEKINFEAMANTGKLIFHTLWELANRMDRIVVDGEIK